MSTNYTSIIININNDSVSIISTSTFIYKDLQEVVDLEGDNTNLYTNNKGTICILERTITKILVLSASNLVNT